MFSSFGSEDIMPILRAIKNNREPGLVILDKTSLRKKTAEGWMETACHCLALQVYSIHRHNNEDELRLSKL